MGYSEGRAAAPRASDSMLGRLADALGIPVSDFSHPKPGGVDQTVELLRLWSGIGCVEERARILAFIARLSPARFPE